MSLPENEVRLIRCLPLSSPTHSLAVLSRSHGSKNHLLDNDSQMSILAQTSPSHSGLLLGFRGLSHRHLMLATSKPSTRFHPPACSALASHVWETAHHFFLELCMPEIVNSPLTPSFFQELSSSSNPVGSTFKMCRTHLFLLLACMPQPTQHPLPCTSAQPSSCWPPPPGCFPGSSRVNSFKMQLSYLIPLSLERLRVASYSIR